uniref:Putative nuclease HARBI1 n=1 Tax=Plectus sambesii TaxID=2011161 RepID=A0A914UQC5_9BILA
MALLDMEHIDRLMDDGVRRALRRERVFRDRGNPLDVLDDLQLYERFRLDRQGIMDITEMLDDVLRRATNRSQALAPSLQVLIALRFYAGGAFQITTGDTLKVSKSSASRAIQRVSLAISARLNEFVYYPTEPADITRVRVQFQAIAGFPGVLGVIDGTQVKVKGPRRREYEYVGRKGGHTMNVQAVALPDGTFSNVLVKYPGSAHDSRIFRESPLYRDLQAGRKQGLLLGDSAYALSTFLMKPLPNPVTDPEKRYQKAFLTTRATVERTFGQLKGRWNCLHQELRYSPPRCCAIIGACVGLRNFATRHHMQRFPAVDDLAEAVEVDDLLNAAAPDGKVKQQQIIRQYFND